MVGGEVVVRDDEIVEAVAVEVVMRAEPGKAGKPSPPEEVGMAGPLKVELMAGAVSWRGGEGAVFREVAEWGLRKWPVPSFA